MYRPLPDSVTILPSNINKLGLIATKDISMQTDLGMCHLELGKAIIRTPLGGFINHAKKPNCVKLRYIFTRGEWNTLPQLSRPEFNLDFKKWHLITMNDIKAGEELTLRYTFYNVES